MHAHTHTHMHTRTHTHTHTHMHTHAHTHTRTHMHTRTQEKNHFILVDMAYQGFATGDLGSDAAGLRLLAKEGHKVALCQSFSKNMGLYGELGEEHQP